MIKINVFRADLKPSECMKYVDGHHKVLEAYGVTQVTSADLSWMDEPYTYIILVESIETGEVYGGGRIQLAGGSIPLPIETAIDQMDPNIFSMVREKARRGTAEFCGLWNSKKVAGLGIGSIILGRVGSAILTQLDIGSIFAFASPATLPLCKRVGFRVVTSLGNNGTFYYPKEDLLATALIIDDPYALEGAEEEEREIIFDLRERPVQRALTHGPRGIMEIEYNLRVSGVRVLVPVEVK